MEWIQYGKTYGDLQHELAKVGETTVGVQIDLEGSEEYRASCSKGLHLIGDINEPGDVSGEEYMMIDDCIITRYRRLLTKEQLEKI
ncbi:hypothetical protein LCGC14_1850700 [marine sediment metagenome]|uniref:Uncharacterized protein n=1 Tax=marine sediment metagenome TaxID=412755 RepID=A0A0F9GAF8_9ZZZZ